MIQVVLPPNLRKLARIDGALEIEVPGHITQRTLLDALEGRYPALRGTLRDHVTGERRPYVRFFACRRDISHESPDAPLPESVVTGQEPFLIIGALSGG